MNFYFSKEIEDYKQKIEDKNVVIKNLENEIQSHKNSVDAIIKKQ